MNKDQKHHTEFGENQQSSGSIDLGADGGRESTDLPPMPGISRRTALKSAVATAVGGAAAMTFSNTKALADDAATPASAKPLPEFEIKDYTKIPQRQHEYPASERAKKVVHDSMTIDTLFSALWPSQWSSPEAPEFHDEMDRCKAAGFKVLAACPSADSLDGSVEGIMKGTEFYLRKMNERPDNYMIVRTTRDIDEAVKQNKLGIYFTHQGTQIFGGDVDRVAFWREVGFGYCLLAYNQRNDVGDGCFEVENRGLTDYGKKLIDGYNRYGMIVDVSHTGERTSLDAIERSTKPVISSHSGAKAVSDYQRSLSDSVIKAVASSGGVCAINMVGAFVDKSNPDIVTTDMLFRHIDYIANLVGIDHVGFGSDYIPNVNFTASIIQTPMGQAVFPDGGYSTAAGAKGFPTPAPYQIVAALVDTMLENGYSEDDCGKFLGANMYRVFEQVWV